MPRTLLDELMPIYDVVERHRTLVRAPPDVVYLAIREADLSGGPLARALFALRALPAVTWRRRRHAPRTAALRLADFERMGFRIVAEREPFELVIGLQGKFWRPRGDLRKDLTVADFAAGPLPGHALAGWNFTVAARGDGLTELRTETRVWCAPDARATFRAYWLLIRPGSGLIRRAMLRAIRQQAERVPRLP